MAQRHSGDSENLVINPLEIAPASSLPERTPFPSPSINNGPRGLLRPRWLLLPIDVGSGFVIRDDRANGSVELAKDLADDKDEVQVLSITYLKRPCSPCPLRRMMRMTYAQG